MVSGAIQVRFRKPPRRAAHHPSGRLDRRQWQTATLERRLPPRPEYAAQLLALLLGQSSRGRPQLSRLAMEDPSRLLRLDETLLRSARAERPDDLRPRR